MSNDFDFSKVSDASTHEFNRREQKERQDAIVAARKLYASDLYSMPIDELEQKIRDEQAAVDAKTAQERQYESARTFTAECPEYISNQKNAERLAAWLEASGLDGSDVDHYHAGFAALKSRGLLQVNPPKPQPRPGYSPRDLYDMPLDDLRKLAEAEPGSVRLVKR